VRHETGARIGVLLVALPATGTTLVVFAATTLADEPATMAALVGVIGLSIVLDLVWKRFAHTGAQDVVGTRSTSRAPTRRSTVDPSALPRVTENDGADRVHRRGTRGVGARNDPCCAGCQVRNRTRAIPACSVSASTALPASTTLPSR